VAQTQQENTDEDSKQVDAKSGQNDADIVVNLITLLNVHTLLRREALIKELVERTGRGRRTVERRLRDVIKDGKLVLKLKQKDLIAYGYEEPDKNAVYIASKEILNTRRSLETIFELFNSDDIDDLKFGVSELRSFQNAHMRGNYLLGKKELIALVKLLEKISKNKKYADPQLVNNLMIFITQEIYIRRKRIFRDLDFLTHVNKILTFFPSNEFASKTDTPIYKLIELLGIYRDYGLIERIKKDAKTCDAQVFRSLQVPYTQKTTAKVIVDNEIELRKLRRELQKEGKTEIVDILNNISYGSANNLMSISKEYEAYLLE
jgi:hypothetical protein